MRPKEDMPLGFDVPTKVAIRAKENPLRPMGALSCPRCGATNPATTIRCRSCLAPLPSKAAATPMPRTVTAAVEPQPKEMDAMFGELEALTREDSAPAVHFQCPECDRLVDASATRCRCGAIFEDPSGVLGYECPICGARVSETATQCSCGARFSG